MKSSGFAESLSWQIGVKPDELKTVDFRVKKEGFPASGYFFESENIFGDKFVTKNSELLGSNWGMGFFRHKACGFCDDIGGELADVSFGDAWLPKYTSDYLGTNIIIVRDELIDTLLNEYTQEVILEKVDVNVFFETQAGNYRNRRGGILALIEGRTDWYPKKRLELCEDYKGNDKQNEIYRYRSKLSRFSIDYFNVAKKYNSLMLFKLMIFPRLVKYNYLISGVRGGIKTIKIFSPMKFIKTTKNKGL